MQIKKLNSILLTLLFATLFLTACADEETSKIIGVWERYDDRAAGTIVVVEKINGHFQGKIVRASDELAGDGFVEKDVKWRKINQETPTEFRGEDLTKATDKYGRVQSETYHEVSFEVIAEDILRVTYSTKNPDDFGQKQKWKRIRTPHESYVADSLPK